MALLNGPNGAAVAHPVSENAARAAADHSRFRLAVIVGASDDAIVGKDLNGIVTAGNSAAATLFGHSSDGVGDMDEISVTDTGPGPPEREPDRLFESFRKAKRGAMGVRLSVCRSIVEAHGGELHCAYGDGSGTICFLAVPAGEGAFGPRLSEAGDDRD